MKHLIYIAFLMMIVSCKKEIQTEIQSVDFPKVFSKNEQPKTIIVRNQQEFIEALEEEGEIYFVFDPYYDVGPRKKYSKQKDTVWLIKTKDSVFVQNFSSSFGSVLSQPDWQTKDSDNDGIPDFEEEILRQ